MENFKWFLSWAGDHWIGTMALFVSAVIVFCLVIEGIVEVIKALRGK